MDFHDMFPPDPNKITVTEEMHPEKEWFEEACHMKAENLPAFYEKMTHAYNHDYGTACHAVAACALAAAWAACGENDTGLSGFQAGFVMWDFIKNWTKTGNECGLRLVDYDDMLYPQCEYKFDKVIDEDTWKAIQNKAKQNIETNDSACGAVFQHWRKIASGQVPFGYRVVKRI